MSRRRPVSPVCPRCGATPPDVERLRRGKVVCRTCGVLDEEEPKDDSADDSSFATYRTTNALPRPNSGKMRTG